MSATRTCSGSVSTGGRGSSRAGGSGFWVWVWVWVCGFTTVNLQPPHTAHGPSGACTRASSASWSVGFCWLCRSASTRRR